MTKAKTAKAPAKKAQSKTKYCKCSVCKEAKFANPGVYAARIKKFGSHEKIEKGWICRDCAKAAKPTKAVPKKKTEEQKQDAKLAKAAKELDEPKEEKKTKEPKKPEIDLLKEEAKKLGFEDEDINDANKKELKAMIKVGVDEFYENEDEDDESEDEDDPFKEAE